MALLLDEHCEVVPWSEQDDRAPHSYSEEHTASCNVTLEY